MEQDSPGKEIDLGGADSKLFTEEAKRVGLPSSDILGVPLSGNNEDQQEADMLRPEE